MLEAKELPKRLWAEAIRTAAYLMNRVPCRKNPMDTPYKLWFGKKPDVSHLRIFGTRAFVLVPDVGRKKFDARAREGILVGYGKSSKIFRVFDQSRNKVTDVTDVKFEEIPSGRLVLVEGDDEQQTESNEVDSDSDTVIDDREATSDSDDDYLSTPPQQPIASRKPGRPKGSKNKPRTLPPPTDVEFRQRKPTNYALVASADPLTAEEALSRSDSDEWY